MFNHQPNTIKAADATQAASSPSNLESEWLETSDNTREWTLQPLRHKSSAQASQLDHARPRASTTRGALGLQCKRELRRSNCGKPRKQCWAGRTTLGC
eukprot:CAMPEP_0204179544 /NCGR_PEP_ID=MMETSP0361-20130328/50242_1 /ASSEMBLY_ACC=CAM_ASM_000343 /TAXON_ID=268821 /ORGANISM="Scrippsiella Hangoei, Strain SHTV-5" /LENGTH=97 /DNA_ID=CAMNT_0051138825 /DNA_START=53 /DNA_END=344 /DNA_ORIENTATION=+